VRHDKLLTARLSRQVFENAYKCRHHIQVQLLYERPPARGLCARPPSKATAVSASPSTHVYPTLHLPNFLRVLGRPLANAICTQPPVEYALPGSLRLMLRRPDSARFRPRCHRPSLSLEGEAKRRLRHQRVRHYHFSRYRPPPERESRLGLHVRSSGSYVLFLYSPIPFTTGAVSLGKPQCYNPSSHRRDGLSGHPALVSASPLAKAVLPSFYHPLHVERRQTGAFSTPI
jgi:hypothetical protein